MNYKHLKSGNGFITKQEIFDRLKFDTPPEGETYTMHKIPGRDFAEVGVVRYGDYTKLFQVYAGNQDLYLYLQGLVCEAATMLAQTCVVKGWPEEIDGNARSTRVAAS